MTHCHTRSRSRLQVEEPCGDDSVSAPFVSPEINSGPDPADPRGEPEATASIEVADCSSAPTATMIDFLHETWLDSERELQELKEKGRVNSEALAAAQERRDALLGQLLVAAEERRNDLWRQLLDQWSKNSKRKGESEPKAPTEAQPNTQPDAQSVALEQSSEHDETAGAESEPQEPHDLDVNEFESEWPDSQLIDLEEVDETVTLSELRLRAGSEVDVGELSQGYEQDVSEDSGLNEASEQPEELGEEPPRKRSRVEASQREARPSSPVAKRKRVEFTTQQKDHIRALICKSLGTRSLPVEEIEPVAEAAALTVTQVRQWISQFYRAFPEPTREQAMAWNSKDLSYRDILNEWLTAHRDYPYPSLEEKERLARDTGRTPQQVDKWLRDARWSNGLASNPRNFSPDQTATLCTSFQENIHPSAGEKQRLASETGLSVEQVSKWFKDRRKRKGLAARKELPTDQKAPLFAWLHANMEDRYPSTDKMKELAKETGLTFLQVKSWFQGSRKRIERNQDKKEYEGRCPCCGAANM